MGLAGFVAVSDSRTARDRPVRGIGRLRARHTDTTTEVDPAKRRTLQLATAAVTLAAIGTAGYGVYEASGPKISRVRVPLARLPEASTDTGSP